MKIKLKDIKVGNILIADGGFTCLKEGQKCEVMYKKGLGLYIECNEKQHFLDGQTDFDTGEYLVGLELYSE